MSTTIEETLQQILRNQAQVLEQLHRDHALIQEIERRLTALEQARLRPEALPDDVSPALIRVLKGLHDADQPLSARETAEQIDLSRNLTSGYLNRLSEKGYVQKAPNLERGGPRYLFTLNHPALPEPIRRLLDQSAR